MSLNNIPVVRARTNPDISPEPVLSSFKYKCYQFFTFWLTFLAFATFHASKTSWSEVTSTVEQDKFFTDTLVGNFNLAFLLAYASGLYFMGYLGDRVNLRVFLTIGTLLNAIGYGMVGIAGTQKSHNTTWYVFSFIIAGIGQATGWPGFVAVMGNWFDKKKRGLLFGLWSGTQNFGHILGYQIPGALMSTYGYSWGSSLMVMELWSLIMAVLVGLFLVSSPSLLKGYRPRIPDDPPKPTSVDLPELKKQGSSSPLVIAKSEADEKAELIVEVKKEREDDKDGASVRAEKPDDFTVPHLMTPFSRVDSVSAPAPVKKKGINYFSAWLVPGVAVYALAFTTIKTTNQGILFWLPNYLTTILHLSKSNSTNISTVYEIGGFVGGTFLGFITDRWGKRAILLPPFLMMATMIFGFLSWTTYSDVWKVYVWLFFAGLFVGGPMSIISAAISNDLAENPVIKGDTEAKATITGILDGCGNLASAGDQELIPVVKANINILFMSYCGSASLVLIPMAYKQFKAFMAEIREKKRLETVANLEPAPSNL